ncbi:hypothetical protein G6045_00960 [Streptomyces sp. YC504]|uniref:Uncharacterized protein n=2 Tax=Streptomyces mesophilus TaxID=1775132 RepID=A0A6G4XAT1_9ACTN|nr:hypothetical protein [Streptomyces mesophilus]
MLGAVGCAAEAADVPQRADLPRRLTHAEEMLVDRAREALIEKCMAETGFTYRPVPVASLAERKMGGYVLDDVTWARRHGYGTRLSEGLADVQRNDPNHAYARGLPKAERIRYSKTLDGDPSGGMLTAELPAGGTVRTPRDSCVAEAKGELYGDFPAFFHAEKAATGLVPLYAPEILKDRRFVNAREEWASCMSKRGHDFADPAAVRERLPQLTHGVSRDKAHVIEVELAVDEAECATKETALVRTARALETEYVDGLDEYRDELTDYRRMQHGALKRARELCAEYACVPGR